MKRSVIEMLNLQEDSLAKINCGLTQGQEPFVPKARRFRYEA